MNCESTAPLTNMNSAGSSDEEVDDNFVMKKCLSEGRHDECFEADPLEGFPDSPVSCDEECDHGATVIWSNPAFCAGDDISDGNRSTCSSVNCSRESLNFESVYGREKTAGQIRHNSNWTDPSQFAVPSRLPGRGISAIPINISVNVRVGGGAREHRAACRADGACGERWRPVAKSAAPGKFPVRRTPGDGGGRIEPETVRGVWEEEAQIRAELAREIEKSLEVEIRQQISKLNRRLEELHAHQRSDIVHQTHGQSSGRDGFKIRADDPAKKFDWVKTLRSGAAETHDNHRGVNCCAMRRRNPQAPFSEAAPADCGSRPAPERSKSEPRRRRVPPKSLHACSPCKSEDDIAVHLPPSNGKGNFNHLQQTEKANMGRLAAAAKNCKVMGKFLPTERMCDSATWGLNNAKKVQFFHPATSPR